MMLMKGNSLMKKCLIFLMMALLLFPLLPCSAEESVIHNKIRNPEDTYTFPEDAQLLEIYFPDIYDADAAFIRYGEYTMLLDCAGNLWQQVDSLLKSLNVQELTYAFLSHPHSDHMYGFQHVLAKVRPNEFLHTFPEKSLYNDVAAAKVYAALHELELPFRRLNNGDTIDFGDVQITVMQRSEPELSGNNASAMLKIELGDRSILFAADIQMDAQLLYVKDNAPIKADILKHPHHGYNRVQRSFLNAVDPELVIVTSAYATANGVALLKETKTDYHYTNLGVMRLATDGHVWTLERID